MSNRGAFDLLPRDVEDDAIVVKEKKPVEKKPKKAAPKKAAPKKAEPAPAKKAEPKKAEPAPAKKAEVKIAEEPEERRARPPRAPRVPRNQQGTGNRPPKREFDRHDGTGRAHEVKKGGAGRGNWGRPGDEAKPEPEAKPRELTEEEKHEEEIRKLRAMQKTYTQYACKQAGQKEVLVSKEGSGAVEADTTELKPIEREDLAAKKVEKTEKTEKKKADKKKAKKTATAEVTVVFSDGHRRFDREDRHEKKVAKASVKDEEAFPALE